MASRLPLVAAVVLIASSKKRRRGPPKSDAEPPPARETPGLPPAGTKATGYPGAASEAPTAVGTQLPTTGPGYVVRRPRNAWGTAQTIDSIAGALERFAELAPEFDDTREVSIGDISRKGGGTLPPHVSHHQGRDVDVNFAIAAGESRDEKLPTVALIPLLVAFLNDDNTKVIYLDWGRQRDVFEALEANPELPFAAVLKTELQYPLAKGTGRTRVRHWDGHARHLHVRYRR